MLILAPSVGGLIVDQDLSWPLAVQKQLHFLPVGVVREDGIADVILIDAKGICNASLHPKKFLGGLLGH